MNVNLMNVVPVHIKGVSMLKEATFVHVLKASDLMKTLINVKVKWNS